LFDGSVFTVLLSEADTVTSSFCVLRRHHDVAARRLAGGDVDDQNGRLLQTFVGRSHEIRTCGNTAQDVRPIAPRLGLSELSRSRLGKRDGPRRE